MKREREGVVNRETEWKIKENSERLEKVEERKKSESRTVEVKQ